MTSVKNILKHNIIDIVILRKKICKYEGPTVWLVILGVMPCVRKEFDYSKERNRLEYDNLFKSCFLSENKKMFENKNTSDMQKDKTFHEVSDMESNTVRSTEQDNTSVTVDPIYKCSELTNASSSLYNAKPKASIPLTMIFHFPLTVNPKILHQIKIDIERLNKAYKSVNGVDIRHSYYNILLLISHRRFKLGYVQGMADILVPFLTEFSKEDCEYAESQAYFGYLALISKLEFNIINLHQNLILRLREELEHIDPELYAYLLDINIDFHIFSFRWFNCIYFREFKYEIFLRIFTVMLGYTDINNFLLYFGVSLLTLLRNDILEKDYNQNILMLQDLYNKEWKDEDIDKLIKRTKKLYKIRESQ